MIRRFSMIVFASLAFNAVAADGPQVAPAESADLMRIFNGKDLAGWNGDSRLWSVRDGAIRGETTDKNPANGNTFLIWTGGMTKDFELRLSFRSSSANNSGIQYRSNHITDGDVRNQWVVRGYQHEIRNQITLPSVSGFIYDEGGKRGRICLVGEKATWGEDGKKQVADTLLGAEEFKKLFKLDDWNDVVIVARGNHLKHYLNDRLILDFTDNDPQLALREGILALQLHAGKAFWVEFKDIRIKSLDLTEQEKKAGWRLLWDGRTTDGWRSAKSESFPARGWEIKDGELTVQAADGAESSAGGDIITKERFSEFELALDFKIGAGANSGIKYFVQPNLDPITGSGAKTTTGSAIGLEFQILDDLRHPDAKAGRDGNRTMASLYDLIPATVVKQPSPIGEWNTARILVSGKQVEHWLNGAKVLEYERGSAAFRDLVKQSKYKQIPGFGEWADGHILLQDHGNRVSFRNIKIRDLAAK